MSILDTPRSKRREMMRADLRAREKAIRASDPNPPEVRELRIRGDLTTGRITEQRLRAEPFTAGFSPAQLAVKGAAARKAEARARA